MGYTAFTKEKIGQLIAVEQTKHVIDLGAQNDYSGSRLDIYISEWYDEQDIRYACIDINGENDAYMYDLSEPLPGPPRDLNCMVVDAGTSEHVGRDGNFDWRAIYNCWLNKFNLLREGGIMYNENPLTGNWPGHGFNYYTKDFYIGLSRIADLQVEEYGLHPACNNTKDGWNVWCTLRKTGPRFCTLEEFKTLDLRTS